jgi:gamma-glutamyltranspeptidase
MNHRSAFVGILAAGTFATGAFVRSAMPEDASDVEAGFNEPEQGSKDQAVVTGVREAAWAPDGKRIAATWFEAIWTMNPDGRDSRRLVAKAEGWAAERDPAWSPDGKSIAFSASSNGQYDLWIAPAAGGAAWRVTSLAGDERWPSWARDGRLVFSHRPPHGTWQLYLTNSETSSEPVKLTPDGAGEWQGRVSPDGKLVAFVSDREPENNNDADLWVRELPPVMGTAGAQGAGRSARVTRTAGIESFPAWAPDNARIAYAAARTATTNFVWVTTAPSLGVPASQSADAAQAGRGAAGPGARGGGGRAAGGPPAGGPAAATTPDPMSVTLASRHGGVPAWSPDGQTLLIATFLTTASGYNGDPNRSDTDPPAAFSSSTSEYALWRVVAPRAVDENATALSLAATDSAHWVTAFDQVWQTLKSMYYSTAESSFAWDALREKYRRDVARATDAASAEAVIDRMIAEQPLMKPAVESRRAVVASGHPLASAAGAAILERGGNVVDAGIAVSFALGVVEPDASSIGGDGQAILFLKGMSEPVVIEYKDMSPSRATPDNPKIFTPMGARTASDGPTVAAIPGVVAGLDLLYQKYGSKKVQWADLIAPAVKIADEGFILDEALPTTVEEGRASFAKYPESARLFLPNGKPIAPGDRFVNKDYAETLRTIAKEGGQSFYRGSIAKRIAADMAANGGIISEEDLAQYRAMERKPLAGRYRNHLVYSVPAPVSTGLQIIETLQILDHYQAAPGATLAKDPDFLHHAIDAWRVRDGGARIADPERWPVDLGNHLDPAHALERFKLIDPKKVYVTQGGGRGGGAPVPESPSYLGSGPDEHDWGGPGGRVQTGTTAFVVADAEGNMIAFTQTLSTWGGNYYVSKGLGFLYNDHFRGGRGGTGFGSMVPLMRTSTTSVPTLVFAPAQGATQSGIPGYTPHLAVGCAGNAWIPASVYSIILNVVDGRMPAQQAIEAPRMLIGGGEGGRSRVQIEDRLPRALLADLEARGHTFAKVGRKGEVKYGYAALAVVNSAKGTVQGGADPRRSHSTAAPGK